jgi:predicted transcriptional regulator
MNNNGNTFTNEFAEMLLGEGIPETIISANQSFLLTPKGRMMTQMVQRM